VRHRKRIEYILDYSTIEAWREAVGRLTFNRYEAQALRGFLEEMENLIDRRDDVDRLRSDFDIDVVTRRQRPNQVQSRRFYSVTKVYFDTYYGALSHLSSVVGRFSKVFGGVAHTDNKSFLVWLKKFHAALSSELDAGPQTFNELESGRLFRALLNHPQQFSPPDWSTETRPGYDVVHLVMHGSQSRSGKIPPGSSRENLWPHWNADWRIDAPDEVSLANCLANASMPILSAILTNREPTAAFVRIETRQAAALKAVKVGGRRVSPGSNVTDAKPPIAEEKDERAMRSELKSLLDGPTLPLSAEAGP
jgi:hypothetical protein